MSGLLDQAGLTAGSGLTNGAGLYRWGNFNPFDPTDLDPYLLFDTGAGSMIGTLENPTLDLDPSNQETLDVITATRSSVATRTLPDGTIALAEQDTVRVDHVDGVPMILVEPSATNLIAYSEDFENTGWTAQAGITLTSNTTETLSPEGLNNSYKVVSADDTKGFFYGGGYISTTAAATRSIFLKGAEGGETITLKDPSGHGTPSVKTLTTEWVRYEMETTNDGNTYQGIFIDNISVGTIYAWGAQVETGSVATSYIPTSGGDAAARTRAADDLEISGSAFSSFFNTGGDGTFFVTAQIKNTETNYSVIRGGSNFQLYVYTNNGSRTHYTYDGGTGASYGSVVENQLTNFAISYNASTYTISKDGSNELSDSASGNYSNATKLEIGSGYSTKFNGHIKRLIYWPYHSDSL